MSLEENKGIIRRWFEAENTKKIFMCWKKGESIWFFEKRVGRRRLMAQILWGVAASCSVFSIYDGIITGISAEGIQDPRSISGAIIGILVFLGLTLMTAAYTPPETQKLTN